MSQNQDTFWVTGPDYKTYEIKTIEDLNSIKQSLPEKNFRAVVCELHKLRSGKQIASRFNTFLKCVVTPVAIISIAANCYLTTSINASIQTQSEINPSSLMSCPSDSKDKNNTKRYAGFDLSGVNNSVKQLSKLNEQSIDIKNSLIDSSLNNSIPITDDDLDKQMLPFGYN